MSRWSLDAVLRSVADAARRAARWLLERIAPERGAPRRVAGPPSRAARLVASKRPFHEHDASALDASGHAGAADPDEAVLAWGDFAGAEEAERFAALPPIEPDAAEGVDWDDLGRELDRRE